MLARLHDWLHERRIRRLCRALVRDPSITTWQAMRDAIQARSAAQIARMERQRGLS